MSAPDQFRPTAMGLALATARTTTIGGAKLYSTIHRAMNRPGAGVVRERGIDTKLSFKTFQALNREGTLP